jgi:hypothetical protein
MSIRLFGVATGGVSRPPGLVEDVPHRISYTLRRTQRVLVRIYDIGAEPVATIVNGAQEGSFRWVGVTGWSGFDAGSGTVSRAVGVIHSFPTDGFPGSIDETIEGGDVIAWSYEASPTTNYYPGETGTFVMNSASFGAPEECPHVPEFGNGIEVAQCLVAYGSMTGSLGFTASRVSGTGPETFVFPGTTYDLPATRLEITIDFSGPTSRPCTRGAEWPPPS